MEKTELRIGDTLLSLKNCLQSSPVMQGELVIITNFSDRGDPRVIRKNKMDSIQWVLDIDDFGVTYELYTEIPTTVVNNVMIVNPESIAETITPKRIDKHYDFFYGLKPEEAQFLQIKIDPYFVSKQWRIGERDHSGALFHILKTIARFGDKNSREREITAIYLQIKRLAELEGVELPKD